MKAVMKQKCEHGAIGIVDIPPPPAPVDNEVLVKIHSAALCGSDIHAYEYIPSYQSFMRVPIVLGHEGSGVVEALGPKVTAFSLGDRVMGESNKYCGKCHNCRTSMTNICEANLMRGLTTDGVMQEYVLIDENSLHKVPANLSFDEAAAAQAVTVSVHGVLHRVNINAGDCVLVSGVGIIGIAAAQLARHKGAVVTMSGTDADEEMRMPVVRNMGFATINCQQQDVAAAFIAQHGRKADFVLECSGAPPALRTSVDVLRKGGSVLLLGLPDKDVLFPFAQTIRSEINIISTYTSTWEDYEKTLHLLAIGAIDIKPLLSGYCVAQAVEAFEAAVTKVAIKPVLHFVP